MRKYGYHYEQDNFLYSQFRGWSNVIGVTQWPYGIHDLNTCGRVQKMGDGSTFISIIK